MNEPKTCTRCGAAFDCGRDSSRCWCSDVPAVAKSLLDPGRDCLCRTCLERVVAAAAAAADVAQP